MKNAFLSMCLILSVCSTMVNAKDKEKPALHWVRNIDEGLKLGREQHKDVLINFTGHGWCNYCTLLDKEIFSKPEFAAVEKDFVLVELDYPSADDYPEGLQELYEAWKIKYMIFGNPIVVLTDDKGMPYAYTGYVAQVGPVGYLRLLNYYRVLKVARDRNLAAAEQVTGIARAKKLHHALSAISSTLGTLDERQNDPLLAFYSTTVDEICQLDANDEAGLLTHYTKRREQLEAYLNRERIYKELDKFDKEKRYLDALVYIDKVLPTIVDPVMRNRFKTARHAYLEWSEQYAAALDYGRELMSEYKDDSEQVNWLLDREAFYLCHLDRIDEAIKIYDAKIAAQPVNSPKRLSAINWKSQMISRYCNDERALAACQDYRDAAEHGSESWEGAMYWLGDELAEQGKHAEAIEMFSEIIKTRGPSPLMTMRLARSQVEEKRYAEARQSLDLTDKLVNEIPQYPDHKTDKDRMKWYREETSRLRGKLDQITSEKG